MAPFRILREHLAEKKLKLTPQRTLILEQFLKSEGHVSAEEVYDFVRKINPEIGQATVYRAMRLLCEAGIARELHLGDGVTRYETKHGHGHHDHLICDRCRKEIEFLDTEIEKLQERQALEHGFTLTGHRMILFGLCPDCQGQRA